MSTAVVTALIAAGVSLILGIFGPMIAVNLNRATAVKLLTEAAEKTGAENKRLNEQLATARIWVTRLVNGIFHILPPASPSKDDWMLLRELAEQARINV